MNLLKIYLIAILLLSFSVGDNGQEPPESADLFDELVGKYNCEDLMARIDYFAAKLTEEKVKGLVIFYKSTDAVDNVFTFRFLNNYKAFRGMGDLYKVIPVDRPSKPGIEFRIDLGGKNWNLEESNPSYDLNLRPESDPIYFSGDLYERVKIDGKWTFLGWDCPSCCIRILSLGVMADFVEANPGSKAYFILRGNRSRATQVIAFLLEEAKDVGLSPANMRFIYAGTKMVNQNYRYVEAEAYISKKTTRSSKAFPYKLASSN
jgi:hypothetical protein